MKKTKSIMALLLTVAIALSLTACSNDAAGNSSDAIPDEAEEQHEIDDGASNSDNNSNNDDNDAELSGLHPGMDRAAVEERIGVYEGTYESKDGTYTTQKYALTYTNTFIGITFNGNNEWLMADDKRSFARLNTEGEFVPLQVFPAFSASTVDGSARILIEIETPTYRELDMDISAKDYIAYLLSVLRDGQTASEPYEVTVAGETYTAITIHKQEDSDTTTEMSMCRRIDDVIVLIHITTSEGISFDDVLSYIS